MWIIDDEINYFSYKNKNNEIISAFDPMNLLGDDNYFSIIKGDCIIAKLNGDNIYNDVIGLNDDDIRNIMNHIYNNVVLIYKVEDWNNFDLLEDYLDVSPNIVARVNYEAIKHFYIENVHDVDPLIFLIHNYY